MGKENSFDVVCEIDMQAVKNALMQTTKEIQQRYDFKGTESTVTLEEREITVVTEDEYRLNSILDILKTRLFKSGISLKALGLGKLEQAAKGMVRQKVSLQQGIPSEKAKEIIKIIKQSKYKVIAQIQNDQVRVTGKKIDELQALIKLLKETDLKIDMQFVNFR
ncbi:MAG: YajQ family cyclic di-GMP-binding protein [Candidatus Schekmanbacteria bacterium]|nr:YajQ family cyclic di-GMP-binding protein [Candidatus Schekmanbacteria bacterium]